MSTAAPIVLSASNVSHAWGLAFVHAMRTSASEIAPLVVSIEAAGVVPPEDATIRGELDRTLVRLGCNRAAISALTIFPYDMWVRRGKPDVGPFSDLCINRLLPRMRARDGRNQYGTYFGRMMAFAGERHGDVVNINQLEFVINLLSQARRPRHSALQIACFDPAKDHTGQPVRGFPCLQQLSIGYDSSGSLSLTAVYPTQYIFDRAYGNYLGLCQLGEFIAHQTRMRFARLTCVIGQPALGNVNKGELRALDAVVRDRLTAAGLTLS